MFRKNRAYPYYHLPRIESLRDMVEQKAKKAPDGIAFAWYDAGQRTDVTYARFANDAERFGAWILAQGCHGTHIGIIGENCYQWLVLFLAVANTGNVAVALDKDMPSDELQRISRKMDVEILFASEASVKKFFGNGDAWIKYYSFETVNTVLRGETTEAYRDEYGRMEIVPENVACIFLTSGTTGGRKGVMLSHANLAADINGSCQLFELTGDVLAVLPFHHAFGLVVAVWMVFHYGHTVFISRGIRQIPRELSLTKPQTMMLVPLFVENFHKQIWMVAGKSGKERKLRMAMKISRHLLRLGLDIRKRLFRDVLNVFGGNLEYIICGGAALDEEYVREFRTFGIEILNGYGTTECSPCAAVNRNFHHKDGTVGLPIPGSEVKISDDGEVMILGEHVMRGYYNDDGATEDMLQDGWYRTGDLGSVDEDGFITLKGRKKNLIVLSSGENVSPEELEEKLLRISGIDEAVVSERDGMIVGEIFSKDASQWQKEDIERKITSLNRSLPMYKRIAEVNFRDTEFEKTTTRKIKRSG